MALSPAVASMAVLCEALAVLLPVVDAIILPRLVEVLELSCRPLGRRAIVLHVRLQCGVEVGIGDDRRPVGGVCVCVCVCVVRTARTIPAARSKVWGGTRGQVAFSYLLLFLLTYFGAHGPQVYTIYTLGLHGLWYMGYLWYMGLWYMPRAASSSVARHAWILLGGERGGAAREPRHREARHREGARKLAHS